jgi:hypothetical protein
LPPDEADLGAHRANQPALVMPELNEHPALTSLSPRKRLKPTSGRCIDVLVGFRRDRQVHHLGRPPSRLGSRARARLGDRSGTVNSRWRGPRRRARHRHRQHRQVAHRVPKLSCQIRRTKADRSRPGGSPSFSKCKAAAAIASAEQAGQRELARNALRQAVALNRGLRAQSQAVGAAVDANRNIEKGVGI